MHKNLKQYLNKVKRQNEWSLEELCSVLQENGINFLRCRQVVRKLQKSNIPQTDAETFFVQDFYEKITDDRDFVEATEQKGSMFVVVGENGEDIPCRKLFSFYNRATGKHYLCYTDGTLDEDGYMTTFVSAYQSDGTDLLPLETEEEWDLAMRLLEKYKGYMDSIKNESTDLSQEELERIILSEAFQKKLDSIQQMQKDLLFNMKNKSLDEILKIYEEDSDRNTKTDR